MDLTKLTSGDKTSKGLYKAIFSGNVDKVAEIIDNVGFSYSPAWEDGYDLLLTAVHCKNIEMAGFLINKGCSLEGKSNSVDVLLLALQCCSKEMVSMLVDRCVSPTNKKKMNNYLLHLAIDRGYSAVVSHLLRRGLNVDDMINGMTCLHVASLGGHAEIVETLLEAGAYIESKDIVGRTSLVLAVSCGQSSIVSTLLKHGASCECNYNGQYPLHDATTKGYVDIVKCLLAYGADLNVKNSLGHTPLHIAILNKKKEIISLLLDAGADVNVEDAIGMVPCDIIVKKLTDFSIIFEDSSISYLMGKHLVMLKAGGFYLNKKNTTFLDLFYNMYCDDRFLDQAVPPSGLLKNVIDSCSREISLMKEMKIGNGLTVYDIFKKHKNPLSVTSENEIEFLKSLNALNTFPIYRWCFINHIRLASKRNELISTAQEWLLWLFQTSALKIPILPEEMMYKIVTYLSDSELKEFSSGCELLNVIVKRAMSTSQ